MPGRDRLAPQGSASWPAMPSPLEALCDDIGKRWRGRSPSTRRRMRAAGVATVSTLSRMVGTILALLILASTVALLAAWHATKHVAGTDAAACAIVAFLWLFNRRLRARMQARGWYRSKGTSKAWTGLLPWPSRRRVRAPPRQVRLR